MHSYSERAKKFENAAAKALLECMERKKSNLCVSVDVTKKENVLRIVEAVAPFVCLIKVNPVNFSQLKSSICAYSAHFRHT